MNVMQRVRSLVVRNRNVVKVRSLVVGYRKRGQSEKPRSGLHETRSNKNIKEED